MNGIHFYVQRSLEHWVSVLWKDLPPAVEGQETRKGGVTCLWYHLRFLKYYDGNLMVDSVKFPVSKTHQAGHYPASVAPHWGRNKALSHQLLTLGGS